MSELAYILLTTAALYTQYYAVFLPIGLTVYALWRWRRDVQALLRWLAAQVAVALLYLPWVLYAVPRLVPYVSQKVVKDADRPLGLIAYFARHLAAFLAGHLEGPLAAWWPVALALLIPLGVGWWLMANGRMGVWAYGRMGAWGRQAPTPPHSRTPAPPHSRTPTPPHSRTPAPPHSRTPVLLLGAVLFVALVAGWLIGLRYPFFPERGERLLLLALPPFILLMAAAVDALWARFRIAGYVTLGLIGAMAGASLFGFYTTPRYATDDYRPLIARTIEQGLPEDTVFCVYPWQVGYWRSYGSAAGPAVVLTPDAAWSPVVAEVLDAALVRGHIWFPAHLALGGILETQIETYLAERGAPFAVEWYGPGTRLSAWAATRGREAQSVAAGPFRFPLTGASIPAVELTGVAVASGSLPAANAVLPLVLSWQADAAPPVLGVSVRLVDAIGQIWAQNDYEPLGELDRLGLLIPAGTPPGTYALEVAVHLKGDGRPLDAFGPDGKLLGTAARIVAVAVTPAGRDLGPERLPIATRQPVDLDDGLRFLGYSADEKPVMPGELRKVSLFWQATAAPAAEYVAFLQLLDAQGRVAAGWEAPPGAAYTTNRWSAGTLIRTQASFRPPAALPDGRYRLIAGLFRAADKTRLRTTPRQVGDSGVPSLFGLLAGQSADHIDLGTVAVIGRPHAMTPPIPQYAADVRLGSFARLVGYDPPAGGIAPGGTLSFTLYWQATGTAERSYTVFVHLLDETGTIRGYGDSEPGEGRLPTASWLAGEYLTDRHEVVVASDASPGSYRLVIGLYDPATGQRLTTPDGADWVEVVIGD